MACLGICSHGGMGDCMIRKPGGEQPGRVFGSARIRSLPVPNLAVKLPPIRGSLTTGGRSALTIFDGGLDLDLATDRSSIGNYYSDDYKYNNNDRSTFIESPRALEKLDEWMTNSVTEIVKNIKHSPLLVQIYADGEVRTSKSLAAEDWPRLIERRSSSSSLEGVILVEELEADDPVDSDGGFDDGGRAFGVVVQGKVKGRDGCKSTCYLLKTTSVNNGGGGGFGNICSHFCLMKVQNFHKSAFSQFSDCWLV